MKRAFPLVALVLVACAGCALISGIDTFQADFTTDGGAEASAPLDAGDTIDARIAHDAGDAREASPIDAAAVCPSVCAEAGVGTCDPSGTCTITCTAAGTCIGPIVCPPEIPCDVVCTGADSCVSTIDCAEASACTIHCVGAGSCKQRISCSGKTCEVDCTGAFTCLGGVCCDAGSCTGNPTACQ